MRPPLSIIICICIDQLPCFWALIPLFILLTLLQAWVCPPHPYTCNTLYVSHQFLRIITKQKSTIVRMRNLHLSIVFSSLSTIVTIFPWSYDVHWPYDELFPSHIRGHSINTKKFSPNIPWSKPYTYIIFPPYFPHFLPSQLYFHKKMVQNINIPSHKWRDYEHLLFFILTLSQKGSKTLKMVKIPKKENE